MPHPHWLSRVEDALKQRGVPVANRRRLLAELGDHIDDLTQGRDITMTDEILNAHLGTPETLAHHTATEYRKSRWTSRHPLLVFGVLPIPLTIFLLILCIVILPLLLECCAAFALYVLKTDERKTMVAFAYTFTYAMRFVPFMLLAFFFTQRYLRSEVSRWWFVCAAVQVLFFASTMISTINYSDTPGDSQMILGFAWIALPMESGWQMPFLSMVGFAQVLQLIVPIAFAVWLMRRYSGERRCVSTA